MNKSQPFQVQIEAALDTHSLAQNLVDKRTYIFE